MSYDSFLLHSLQSQETGIVMKSTTSHLAFALILAAAAPLAHAQTKPAPSIPGVTPPGAQAAAAAKPVTVNGKPISKARVDFVIKQQLVQGQKDSEQLRRAVLEDLISKEVVVQEAERRGLTRNSDIQMQLDLLRQEVLARAVFSEYLKTNPIRDDEVKVEYEKIKAQRGEKEYKARHILVDSEAAAKEITDKLKKGEKFEELAKQSKDPGSKDRGGDLDWASAGNYVKPFADALAKLDKGKLTDAPVQSQFGWHVIRLDDVRSTQFPPLDQVRQQLVNAMQQQEFQKMVSDLRAKAKIE